MLWHCQNLSVFVAIYKAICSILRKSGIRGGVDALVAGGVGGWFAFGASTGVSGAVNQQINLYLFARGVEGLLRALCRRFAGSIPEFMDMRKPLGFRVLTASTIAVSMCMMDYEPSSLREGLVQAMRSIYHESNSGSAAVPWNWWPLVAGCIALIFSPLVSKKLSLEHLTTLF